MSVVVLGKVARALNQPLAKLFSEAVEAIDKGQAFVAEELSALMDRQGEEAERTRSPGVVFSPSWPERRPGWSG